jgi:hypothetical protein
MNAERTVLVQPLNLVRTRRMEWVWADMIPERTLTLLAGTAGIGKSTILAWVAAALTRGELPGVFHGKPVVVGFLAAEDDLEATLAPRLDAAGANRELISSLSVQVATGEETWTQLPTISQDLSQLEREIKEHGIKVLIVDPVVSVMDGDSVKLSDVRRNLDRLAALCERADCSVIAVTHFNKGAGNASEKITGSSAFRDTARSVLLLAVDEESEQRILSVDKSNYSPVQKSLAFMVSSASIRVDNGGETVVGRAELLGETALRVHDLVGSLGEDKRAILALAKGAKDDLANGGEGTGTITTEQVIEQLALLPGTARQKLRRMVKEGHLQRVKDGVFILTPQAWQGDPAPPVTRNAVTAEPETEERYTVTPLREPSLQHPRGPHTEWALRTLRNGGRNISDRVADKDPAPHTGHWPITGFWCSVCGWPMHPAIKEFGGHPCCLEPPRHHKFRH